MLRELRASEVRNGILGSFGFDVNGDITTTSIPILRITGATPPGAGLPPEFQGATVDRVVQAPTDLCSEPRPWRMSIKSKMLAAAATLTIVGAVIALDTLPASAATPACGSQCGSIFSRELGTYAQPSVVEGVLQGVANVGQPVILKQASGSDPSEDIIPHRGLVSAFYAAGMVSADVNKHYGNLLGVQQEYAPYGVGTGLCVGLASIAYQNEGLTLQPCSIPGRTVWIIDTPDSPATAATGYFPIVNASTTKFERPFAMDLPQDEVASDQQTLQIHVRHLKFLTHEKTLPDSQLWGFHPGVLN